MNRKRHVIKDLSLSEISGVTIPAQSHALVSIMKSESCELVKYLSTDEGAKTFDAFMAEENRQRIKNDVSDSLWSPLYALRDTIVSINLDNSLDESSRFFRISEAVSEFNKVVNPAPSQHLEKRAINNSALLKMLTDHEDFMSEDVTKKAEALEAQVAELTKSLAAAEILAKLSDAEKEYLAGLEGDEAEKFKAADAKARKAMMSKAAEADEVFKSAEGHEIRKSVVGDSVFAILKSQDSAIRSAREEMVKAALRAQTVELTKRAEEELANLPGDTVSKVAVLKGLASLDEAAQETLNAMLKAGNDALAKGFQTYGVAGGKPSDLSKSAKLAELIKKARENDPTLNAASALDKVLSANPELYEG